MKLKGIRQLEKVYRRRFEKAARLKAKLYTRLEFEQNKFLDRYLVLKSRFGQDHVELRGDKIFLDRKVALQSRVSFVRARYGKFEAAL